MTPTPNTVDALMELVRKYRNSNWASLASVEAEIEASASALAAMPAQSESALAVMMDRDAWRAGLIGLCQGPEPKSREAALEHLRGRLHAKAQQAGGVDKAELKRLVSLVFGEEFQITRAQPLSEAQPRKVTAFMEDGRGMFLDFNDGTRVFYEVAIDHEIEDDAPLPTGIVTPKEPQ